MQIIGQWLCLYAIHRNIYIVLSRLMVSSPPQMPILKKMCYEGDVYTTEKILCSYNNTTYDSIAKSNIYCPIRTK